VIETKRVTPVGDNEERERVRGLCEWPYNHSTRT
jgi:hypothetical protein